MNSRQLLGIVGGMLMILGPFLPFASAPMAGDTTWYEGEKAVAIVVAVLGLGTIVLAARNQMRVLWLTGGVSLALVAYTYYDFQLELSGMKQELETSLAGNPLGILATAAADAVELKWGLPVVLVGALLAIAAAALRSQAQSRVPAAT